MNQIYSISTIMVYRKIRQCHFLKVIPNFTGQQYSFSSPHGNVSSGSGNLSGGGADDSQNLRLVMVAIFFLTSFNRGPGHPPDPLLNVNLITAVCIPICDDTA